MAGKLNFALAYAKLGWPVLPLYWMTAQGTCSCGKACRTPGKHPMLFNGLKEASTDQAAITVWFTKWPAANIGVVTGHVSGTLVVDVDPKNGGEDTLDALRAGGLVFPDDVMQITGSGGRHFFYLYPGATGKSRTNLWPGIDIRGDGGYVVAPPSNHVSGTDYFWDAESDPLEGATLPPCPDFLLQKLAEKATAPPAGKPDDPDKAYVIAPDEVRRIRAALAYIPADDRDTWLNVGMALQASGAGEQAFGLWCEWAQKSDKFDFKDSSRVWASFKPGGGVNLATVFGLAKDYGWVLPKGKKPKNAAPKPAPARGQRRAELEQIIDGTDDFEELAITIANLVKSAKLSKPAREYLLGKIAKKTNAPKSSLGGEAPGGDGEDGDGGDIGGLIDELNQRHAIVRLSGRVLVLNRDYDPALKKNYFTFSMRRDFEFLYCNRKVWHHGEFKELGRVWAEHPRRTQYEGISFMPGGESNGFLNLWQGWGVDADAGGGCHRFIEFVMETICAGDENLFDYVTKWCAHLVQRPQELPETALVLRGKEGAGKNTLAKVLGQIVGGEHFLLLTSMGQVSGRFTGHLANALLVFCNEAVWGGDKQAQGVLKSMITDAVQPVEHKGRDVSQVANFKRLLLASNEDWVVPRGANDRHYVIIDVDDGRIGDFAYWQALAGEIDNGCAGAFMAYLQAIDIKGWHPRQIPQRFKERGWDLKIRGAGSVVQWWFDVLDDGWLEKNTKEYSGNDDFVWPEEINKEKLVDHYIAWATKRKVAHIEGESVIGRHLAKFGIRKRRLRQENTDRKAVYFLPKLADARKKFSNLYSIPEKVLQDESGERDIFEVDLTI